jgi:hypothetical protein
MQLVVTKDFMWILFRSQRGLRMIGIGSQIQRDPNLSRQALVGGVKKHQETSSERSNAVVCGFDVCFDKKTRLGIRIVFVASRSGHKDGGSPG